MGTKGLLDRLVGILGWLASSLSMAVTVSSGLRGYTWCCLIGGLVHRGWGCNGCCPSSSGYWKHKKYLKRIVSIKKIQTYFFVHERTVEQVDGMSLSSTWW